jgi:hypothetical protein
MAAPLYSYVFLSESDFTGEAAFEIPADLVVVVRDLSWTVKGPSAGATIWCYDTDGNQWYGNTSGVIVTPIVSGQWAGHQVVPGPGFVYCSTDADTSFRMSGFLLSSSPP